MSSRSADWVRLPAGLSFLQCVDLCVIEGDALRDSVGRKVLKFGRLLFAVMDKLGHDTAERAAANRCSAHWLYVAAVIGTMDVFTVR
jgi:hypothetical protein